MVEAKDLPYLIQLFDDQSPTVHRAVVDAMRGLGPDLPSMLRSMPTPPGESRIAEILDSIEPSPRSIARSGGASATERIEDPPAAREAMFVPGQLVSHRRYGYRGVVVDSDESCQASEEWYRSNRTQPVRDQPWYHVLVDGSEQITYVAQTNLATDEEGRPIQHPLVEYFFEGFADGVHQRNDRPWPSPGDD